MKEVIQRLKSLNKVDLQSLPKKIPSFSVPRENRENPASKFQNNPDVKIERRIET